MNEKTKRRTAIALSALLAFVLFLSTLQTTVNGDAGGYTIDVGEIQNALPRWGTIHFTGYPQYTMLGSIFVNALQLFGVAPAAGASLYSATWGAVATGLLTALILALGVPPVLAAGGSVLYALSTSMWVDASIAELHTMTMALTFAALLVAVRFRRDARPGDLYWLAFLAGQGLAHQRSFAFIGAALAVLVVGHWRLILEKWLPVLGLALLGPLTYLYLPLVDWLGSDWVFSNPGTWQGFRALLLDTKADRIISIPTTLADLSTRLQAIFQVLNDDWPWPLWVIGLLGIAWGTRRTDGTERLALTLGWLTYLILSVFIWIGYVADALLAAKMPVVAMAAVGIAFVAARVWRRVAFPGRVLLFLGLVAAGAYLYVAHRPAVLEVTRNDSAAQTIALAERIPPAPDGRPITLMALWGNDFWQLAYAQTYEGHFPHLNLVDHNANFAEILDRGDHLYTLSRTLYERRPEWWAQRLGAVHLSQPAPDIVEIRREPRITAPAGDPSLLLDNGITIRATDLHWLEEDLLRLVVWWRARTPVDNPYSVAVHLVRRDPPAVPSDVIAQADEQHPVDGWYPVTRWKVGETVRDVYLLSVPPDTPVEAVRVSMYRRRADGQFQNTVWLSLPVPPP